MAGSVNKVILVGNLGRDPEIRTLNSGDRVANLRIATSETWRDKATGERKEKTEWHSVVIFNENIVKVAEQYLKKGSTVYVEGSLQTRKYTPFHPSRMTGRWFCLMAIVLSARIRRGPCSGTVRVFVCCRCKVIWGGPCWPITV